MNKNLLRALLILLACGMVVSVTAAPLDGPAAKGIDTSPLKSPGGKIVITAKTAQNPDLFASANAAGASTDQRSSAIVDWIYTLSTGDKITVK